MPTTIFGNFSFGKYLLEFEIFQIQTVLKYRQLVETLIITVEEKNN
jgi:hypothetical protein